ncbi:hypothetical protein RE432_14870 [Pusillimonas sp. SM2304]|uniref:portal protein n=1 Tax=Pusillimonas sp. SM2304 TaxID=3073241 RepID=UPI0028761530|nr:hypothetical protein [Pusillimonas sp. SM2304]MDS1141722.1 hypothetical protein [Pusillimonas sp. SM2304]
MNTAVKGFDLLDHEYADGQITHAHDQAPADRDALNVSQLERWLQEIRNQPEWRREADKCVDYYDGNQLDADTLQRLEDKGLGPLITNLIAPTVNAVLGMEAKTRTDWQVGADDDQHADVAEAMSAKLHEAERESQADRANSDAYAALIKAGFGAVEVSRESNPFRYPYRVSYIHRSELFWDWHCRKPDWSDARYVVRKKQFDADHIAAFFPKHKEIIRAAGNWPDWTNHLTFDARMSADLMHSIDQGLRTSWDDLDWRDTTRNRVVCYEVWYRVWVRGLVLRLPGGRVIEFNPKNNYHRAVVAAGAVQPQVAIFDRIRCAFYIGPIRVQDIATSKRRFPYVPFFGYREDLTGVPYGLIRTMLSPQDEVNARSARMMWLLNGRRVFIDGDALDDKYNTMSDVTREVARADAFIVMDQNRVNKQNAIKVDDNMGLSQQQFSIMQERKQAIQEAAGVYNAMMGQQSNATSGLAIQSLVEQGVTTLAEINDNYRMARRGVGEALLDLIKEDMIDQTEVMVDNGMAKRRVVVNIPRVDPETGQRYKENDVQTAPVKVALSDVPSTPTYRAQQFGQFAEILKSMPPDYQALLVPFALEMSDFSRRKEMAEFLRKQMGIVADPNSPEAQQAEQAAKAAQGQALQLEQGKAEAEIAEKTARAEKLKAETAKLLQPEPAAQPAQQQDTSAVEIDKALIQKDTELEKARIREAGETERAQMVAGKAGQIESLAAEVAQLIEEINQA